MVGAAAIGGALVTSCASSRVGPRPLLPALHCRQVRLARHTCSGATAAAAASTAAARQRQQHLRPRWAGCQAAAAGAAAAAAAAAAAPPPPMEAAAGAAAAGGGAAGRDGAAGGASTAAAPQQQQQQQEQQQASSLNLADLWLLLRHDWRRLAACLTFTAISVCCAVSVAPILGSVIDIISKGTAATPQQLAAAVGKLGATYIIANVSLAVQTMLALELGESVAHRLRCRLFDALLRRDPLFFDSVRTGQLAAWLGQDIEVLQSTVAKLLGARGIRSAFETVGIIAVLLSLSWPLAAVLLASAPLLTPLVARLGRQIGAASKDSQAAANNVSAAATEIVENMRVVKLFAQQRRELARFGGLLEGAHQLALKVLRLQALLDASSRVRNTMCVLAVLGLGAYMALHNQVTIGTCYSFFVYSFSFTFALGNLTNAMGDIARAGGAVSRVMQTLHTALGPAALADGDQSHPAAGEPQQQQQQQPDAEQAPHPAAHGFHRQLPEGWRGDIEFRDVGFSHPGGWSLKGISFSVPAGQKVALVGPSGGGKSTLAALLQGLYRPSGGAILVGGVPLDELDLGWWRRQLGVVAQEPGLLAGRVADVIRYGAPHAGDSEVEWAARVAQAHGFIAALPDGYQTEIGAGTGVELSGGQRQRLAIARALLARPRVLIFDEATSALDVETEQGVTSELEAAGRGVTSLIIAHRLSTVRRADRIVVVAGGEVVEQGTHEELMARPGGVYWSLVTSAESKGQEEWDMPAAGANGSAAAAGSDGQPQLHVAAASVAA